MAFRKMMTALFSALGMLILILDGEAAMNGAVKGVELCIRTVVPSLFPFLFLCTILTNSLWGGDLFFLRPLGKILGIPNGAESLLLSAFLGGYPAGAQVVGELYHSRRLKKETAEHMLAFCSNAGPAFLFGMTAVQFPDSIMVWKLWFLQIIAAVMTALTESGDNSDTVAISEKDISISVTLGNTVKTMGVICGWILLFRILLSFLESWFFWRFPKSIQILLSGMLELSNGCCSLGLIDHLLLRFVICSVLLSFGGICVTMQTASVIRGLSLIPYIRGKMMQTCFALLLSVPVYWDRWGITFAICIGVLFFRWLPKKTGRFSGAFSV